MRLMKLLVPGLRIKRWLGLTLIGLVVLALGLAYLFVELYRTVALPMEATYITLQFVPSWLRGLIFVLAGASVTALAVMKLNRSLAAPLAQQQNGVGLVDALVTYRQRERGPKIVTIGGGTGLSTMLRGLKNYSANITAIVTVADDGGSSGRLRRELGVLPPGDFRNCIVALADAEPLMSRLFQYRFGQGTELDGHSFGNLFIVAMSGITGNFEEAIREASRVLAVRGQIIPSTLENVTLCAELEGEAHVLGESKISATNGADPAGLPPAGAAGRLPGRRPRDPGGGHRGRRPGQPLHQHPAEPAGGRHRQGARLHRGAADLRLQRGDPARRDRRVPRQRPRQGAAAARARPADRRGAGEQQPGRRHQAGVARPARRRRTSRRWRSSASRSPCSTWWTRTTPCGTARSG